MRFWTLQASVNLLQRSNPRVVAWGWEGTNVCSWMEANVMEVVPREHETLTVRFKQSLTLLPTTQQRIMIALAVELQGEFGGALNSTPGVVGR